MSTQLLVLGAGPGGYTAAFRAADLGLEVTLVERHETLGGVCLNVGCIPSKALLHLAKLIADARRAAAHGVAFAEPEIDLQAIRAWKDGIVSRLTGGLAGMAEQRGVRVLRGEGRLIGPRELTWHEGPLEDGQAVGKSAVERRISFEHLILATGSRTIELPGIPQDDPRVMTSTGALALSDLPARLLVIGGGTIGLEMASVYEALGSRVTVLELSDRLIPGCDPDLVAPLQKRISERFEAIHLSSALARLDPRPDGLRATLEDGTELGLFDRALVAVGRRPNSDGLGLEAAGVAVDESGFVAVDGQLRTSAPHIHAIGDLVGAPMLAHKATHEAKIAAEAIAGQDVAFDVRGIPSVAYTDPEIAWVGLTETEADRRGIAYERAVFPWSASGRAIALDSADGLTKLLLDTDTGQVLGAGIVGSGAGELIAEPGFALELGADAQDLALTVHPHPTLSESVGLSAEVALGTITDLPAKRR